MKKRGRRKKADAGMQEATQRSSNSQFVVAVGSSTCSEKEAESISKNMDRILQTERDLSVNLPGPSNVVAYSGDDPESSSYVHSREGMICHMSAWDANDWPTSTTISCFWCCEPFDNVPLKIPIRYDERKRKFSRMFGNFCSFSCCKSYAMESVHIPNSCISNIYLMFQILIGKSPNQGIPFAPPRLSLVRFGGPLSIGEFRQSCLSPTHLKPSEHLVTIFKERAVVMPINYAYNGIPHQGRDGANTVNKPQELKSKRFVATQERMQLAANKRRLANATTQSTSTLESTMGLKVSI